MGSVMNTPDFTLTADTSAHFGQFLAARIWEGGFTVNASAYVGRHPAARTREDGFSMNVSTLFGHIERGL